MTIARHGLCYGYMPMIIIHCERDRGICAHRINKTCCVHARCHTATATGAWPRVYDVCNVYDYGYGYAYAYGPSQAPVHAPKINLLSDYLRIRHCHLPYNYMTVSQTHSHSQPEPEAEGIASDRRYDCVRKTVETLHIRSRDVGRTQAPVDRPTNE